MILYVGLHTSRFLSYSIRTGSLPSDIKSIGFHPLLSITYLEAPLSNKHFTIRVLFDSNEDLTAKCRGVSPSESYALISCCQLSK